MDWIFSHIDDLDAEAAMDISEGRSAAESISESVPVGPKVRDGPGSEFQAAGIWILGCKLNMALSSLIHAVPEVLAAATAGLVVKLEAGRKMRGIAVWGLRPFGLGTIWKPVREGQRKCCQVKDRKWLCLFLPVILGGFSVLQTPVEKTGSGLWEESVQMFLCAVGRGNPCPYPPGTHGPSEQLEERRLNGSYHLLFHCTYGLETKSLQSCLTGTQF